MTDENQETMTAAVTTAVIDAIRKRDSDASARHEREKADELNVERAAKRFLSIRDIVIAIGFFAALIGGASVTFAELQDKPSKIEVAASIDAKVGPLVKRITPVEKSVQVLTDNVSRMQDLLEMQMQHADWRADVEDCRAQKSCKRAPKEPQSLKDKRRELMTQRAR